MKHDLTDKPDSVNIVFKDIDFERMHRAYYLPLCSYAKGFVKQKEESEDIVSEFFTTLAEKKDNIFITGELKSYLYRGVKNNCLDFLRHDKIKRVHSEQVLSLHANGERLLTYDDHSPHSILESQEIEEEMKKAIDKLSKQQREIVLMRLEGYSYQKIAEKINISEGTVCKHINRAKTLLWKKLKKE